MRATNHLAPTLAPTVWPTLSPERERGGAAGPEKKSRGAIVARLPLSALAMLGALAGAGCALRAAPQRVVRPLMVRVPVLHETPCSTPALADPALPIAGLTSASEPADTMRAYAAAVAILKGAVRERDAVLAGCARAAGKTPAAPATRAQAESTQ